MNIKSTVNAKFVGKPPALLNNKTQAGKSENDTSAPAQDSFEKSAPQEPKPNRTPWFVAGALGAVAGAASSQLTGIPGAIAGLAAGPGTVIAGIGIGTAIAIETIHNDKAFVPGMLSGALAGIGVAAAQVGLNSFSTSPVLGVTLGATMGVGAFLGAAHLLD